MNWIAAVIRNDDGLWRWEIRCGRQRRTGPGGYNDRHGAAAAGQAAAARANAKESERDKAVTAARCVLLESLALEAASIADELLPLCAGTAQTPEWCIMARAIRDLGARAHEALRQGGPPGPAPAAVHREQRDLAGSTDAKPHREGFG